MQSPRTRWLAGAALAAVAAAVATRVTNALRYPPFWGFDAPGNWEYVEQLTRSWALPAPEEGWSAAHPPLFYYLCAALVRATGLTEWEDAFVLLRLATSAAFGLATAALAAALAWRLAPGNRVRAALAAGVLLFLPAHVYLSAMLSEELLASFLASCVVAGAVVQTAGAAPRRDTALSLGVGVAGGLALLVKLSGLLAIAAACFAYLVHGARRGAWRGAVQRSAIVLVVAGLVGGWFYARNVALYGAPYPHGLDTHEVMFEMPPGERGVGDYLRVPLATFADPDLLSEPLLRSVWGSTYATLWFEAHRHFVPRAAPGLGGAATALLVLGLVPTLAFFAGALRGVRRAWRAGGADVALAALAAATIVGYVAFTWRNPWFATLKGSYLMVAALPFALWTSEALDGWLRGPRARTIAVGAALAALAVAVSAVFTFGLVFTKTDATGLPFLTGG